MSKDTIVYRCECKKPQLAVDGDTDSVFCRRCGGVLGYVDEVCLNPDGTVEIIKAKKVEWDLGDIPF
jgi:hypothetical protein